MLKGDIARINKKMLPSQADNYIKPRILLSKIFQRKFLFLAILASLRLLEAVVSCKLPCKKKKKNPSENNQPSGTIVIRKSSLKTWANEWDFSLNLHLQGDLLWTVYFFKKMASGQDDCLFQDDFDAV